MADNPSGSKNETQESLDLILSAAVMAENRGAVRDLLARGANPDARLHVDSLPQAEDDGMRFVDEETRQAAYAGKFTISLLMAAVHLGKSKVVAPLVRAGVDVHTATIKNGITVLHQAVGRGYIPLAKLLISAGCDLHKTNKSGKSALDYAENDEIRQALLEREASYAAAHPPRPAHVREM
jgi:predicted methyltransferase